MLLNYTDQGPGPLVVLLHGFPFDRTLWSAQVAKIGAVYRIIAPDLRGHGKSAAPDGTYRMDDMADDVIELLDALQLFDPVIIGGHSMGGYVALSAAVRYPKRFRGLMLINSKAVADTPEASRKRLDSAAEIEATGKTGSFIEGLVPRLFAEETREKSPDLVAKMKTVMAKTPPRAIVGALRGMAERPDRTADLARIDLPTLVITGESDQVSPPGEARSIAERLPNAEVKIISKAGHLAPVENPDATNRAIFEYLNRIEGV